MKNKLYVCPNCKEIRQFENKSSHANQETYVIIECKTCNTQYSPSHGLGKNNKAFVNYNPQMSDKDKEYWLPNTSLKRVVHYFPATDSINNGKTSFRICYHIEKGDITVAFVIYTGWAKEPVDDMPPIPFGVQIMENDEPVETYSIMEGDNIFRQFLSEGDDEIIWGELERHLAIFEVR